ncbi:MAG: GldG family protein, partial [Geminicoccaceae bacterium]
MWQKLKAADRNRLGLIGIGLSVVLFVAINVVAGTLLTSQRLDLTADRLFIVSKGTKEVLASIDEPIDLRLYYSDQLNQMGPYFTSYDKRVEDLLSEYRRLSGGKLRIERLDPEPFSPEEDLAVAEGLRGLPLSDDGALAYFGVSGRNSTDDLQVIAYLAPERANFLEYDLTRMVYDLAHPKKPVIAVIGDLPLMGSRMNRFQPWRVLDTMYQFFDVRFLGGKQDKIDDDVDVLMLAQPQKLDAASLYGIDQFVMRGGRVVAFVDPFAEALQARQPGMPPPQGSAIKTLEPLLKAWGVQIADDKVIGDRSAAQRVTAYVRGRQAVIDYLPWLSFGADNLAQNDVVVGELQRLNLHSAGAITARDGATTKIEPLLVSSPLAMEIDTDKNRMMADPAALIADFQPAGKPFTLAARVTGPVKSAFPDGPPEGAKAKPEDDPAATKGDEAANGSKPESAHLTEAKAPLNLILVADSDLLADQTWVRSQDLLGQQIAIPVANNGDFAVNALENLSGSEGLIGLRGRGVTSRPFEVVRNMQQEAEYKFRAKEQELRAQIDDTKKKIGDLQQEEQKSGVILTGAQQNEIERFRGEMIRLRQELRDVQRSLRENVERLSTAVKIVNIWAVPVLVAVAALIVALLRRARRA